LYSIVACVSAWVRNPLEDASNLVEATSYEGIFGHKDKEECTNGCFKRVVMNILRSSRYNTTVCKSRWDHAKIYLSGKAK